METKMVAAPNFSTYIPMYPPMMLATKEESIQTPINIEANFNGASFVTTDNPTGERQSSPMVWKKYVITNQIKAAFCLTTSASPVPDVLTLKVANNINKNPIPSKIIPSDILTGVVNLLPIFVVQNQAKIGPNIKINAGFTL